MSKNQPVNPTVDQLFQQVMSGIKRQDTITRESGGVSNPNEWIIASSQGTQSTVQPSGKHFSSTHTTTSNSKHSTGTTIHNGVVTNSYNHHEGTGPITSSKYYINGVEVDATEFNAMKFMGDSHH